MKRYHVMAKRRNKDQPWSEWTLVNNYNRAEEHARYVEEVGYAANIEIKEPGVEELWNILGTSYEGKEKADAILDAGFRKQDVVIDEFKRRFEFYLQDIEFSLGQTNGIQYALKKATEEMKGENK